MISEDRKTLAVQTGGTLYPKTSELQINVWNLPARKPLSWLLCGWGAILVTGVFAAVLWRRLRSRRGRHVPEGNTEGAELP